MATNEELEARLDELTAQFENFKMFAQRKNSDIRNESKAYGAQILSEIEALQDQINSRFEQAHSRMDAMNTLLEKTAVEVEKNGKMANDILAILRSNLGRLNNER